MTAVGNGRTHTFTGGQLGLAGLAMVAIGAVVSGLYVHHHDRSQAMFANGADTPIVISGGSVHFRAKKSDWETCDANPARPSTTCYKATFKQSDKNDAQHFQFFNDDDLTAVDVASVTSGWEIDVFNKNPDNRHMVLVCAKVNSTYTACDPGAINANDNSIYVIAKGGGTFEQPTSAEPRKLLYDDGNPANDDISKVVLNASATGATTKNCTKPHCAVFLSK